MVNGRSKVSLAVVAWMLVTGARSARAADEEGVDRSRIVFDGESSSVDVQGLPALSANGTTVAAVEYFETTSDASQLVILLLRADRSEPERRLVVHVDDDYGRRQPFPADGLGTTLWRRARNVNALLEAGGFRAMRSIEVQGSDSWRGVDVPAWARVAVRQGRAGRFTVREVATDRRRHLGRLPQKTYYCGLEETPAHLPWPSIAEAWEGRGAPVALLEFGHSYASCMCPNDLTYRVVPLGR
jgi:hypothetical protein